MIKPVTYQGKFNFNANLYALEIKSRFIDQVHADGYYTGYGSELEAKIVGNQIQIGTGAFVVQGRMNEVVSTETVMPQIYNNFVGYVVARIETYHPSDDNNCTFKAYVNTELSEIPLRQDNVYALNADNENLVYELPIYSFEIKDGAITNLVKLIRAVDDYARVQKEIEQIQQSNQEALESVQTAKENLEQIVQMAQNRATTAAEKATSANTNAANAVKVASQAVVVAEQAKETAEGLAQSIEAANQTAEEANQKAENAARAASEAVSTVESISNDISEYKEQIDEKVTDLEAQIVQGGGGSNILVNGELKAQVRFNRDPQSQLDIKQDFVTIADSEENKMMAIESLEKFQSGETNKINISLFDVIKESDGDHLSVGSFVGCRVNGIAPSVLKTFDVCSGKIEIDGSLNMDSDDAEFYNWVIRLVSEYELNRSDWWTVGSANIKFPRKGVYLVEFEAHDSSNTLFLSNAAGCSICVNHGKGYTSINSESYTSFITYLYAGSSVSGDNSSCVKIFPYRDRKGVINLYAEAIGADGRDALIIDTVRFYQII